MCVYVSVVATTTCHLINGGEMSGLFTMWHSGESHSGLLILNGVDSMSITRIIFTTEPSQKVNAFSRSGWFQHRSGGSGYHIVLTAGRHLSQCMLDFGLTRIMIKYLHFEIVCFV